ncbi:MAG: PrgI family protein [Candidatus Saccharimonadia bacterium]
MAQYKVPQDVEAEDKIIGFLTLKQFIYSVIGFAWLLITYELFKSILFVFLIVGVPPALIFLLLGLYQRDGQPFEAYFIALINYWFKPRRRLWIKEELIEVFKIEQPKVKQVQTQLDPRKVQGELERLAEIVDTRGWSSKQPEVQESDSDMVPVIDLSDRLATNELVANTVEPMDVGLNDDMLSTTNPSMQNLNELIHASEKNIREEALERVQAQLPKPKEVKPGSIAQPEHLAEPAVTAEKVSVTEMTVNPIADILKRAMENSDLKVSQVSQIAAQANQANQLIEGQSIDVRPNTQNP